MIAGPTFQDMRHAIRFAHGRTDGGPQVVGYLSGSERKGWIVFPAIAGAPQGVEPDVLCFGLGTMPVPLSEAGRVALITALCSFKSI